MMCPLYLFANIQFATTFHFCKSKYSRINPQFGKTYEKALNLNVIACININISSK